MTSFIDSNLPGWEGVVRTSQNDNENTVVKIHYSEEFEHLMDIFRTLLATKEYSARALGLTTEILEQNAGNYTVWQYRRECLLQLKTDLQVELDYLDTYADDNPKNYQIWYHRRVVVQHANDPTRELGFTFKVFEDDAKNYHAWAHRQWVLKTYATSNSAYVSWWSEEMEYIDNLITMDPRNNSAWNQRWFVVHGRTDISDDNLLIIEFEYVKHSICRLKLNESSWNYIRGLWNKHQERKDVVDFIEAFCDELLGDTSNTNNHFMYSFLVEINERRGTKEGYIKAQKFLKHLIEIDTLRVKYWTHRLDIVNKLLIEC